jgi:diacylglycerol kinase family enzyme
LEKNILFVVNPISGDVDKAEMTAAVAQFADKENKNLVIYETNGRDDIAKIKALYKTHLPERIVIAGGDGTIKMVAEAMENVDVILGILPAGSANGLSVDLNLPTTIDENLSIAFRNNYMEVDMVRINGKNSLHLSDIGLNADLVKNYENSETRGMWGYALQAYTTLKEANEPFHATITANNEIVETMARMIFRSDRYCQFSKIRYRCCY